MSCDFGGTKFDLFFTREISSLCGCDLLKCSRRRSFLWNSCKSTSSSFLFCFGVGVNFSPLFNNVISWHVSSRLEMFITFGSTVDLLGVVVGIGGCSGCALGDIPSDVVCGCC